MAADALPLLVALLGSDQPALQSSAAGARKAIGKDVGSHQNRFAIAGEGVVPVLSALAHSDQLNMQEAATTALSDLTIDS